MWGDTSVEADAADRLSNDEQCTRLRTYLSQVQKGCVIPPALMHVLSSRAYMHYAVVSGHHRRLHG